MEQAFRAVAVTVPNRGLELLRVQVATLVSVAR